MSSMRPSVNKSRDLVAYGVSLRPISVSYNTENGKNIESPYHSILVLYALIMCDCALLYHENIFSLLASVALELVQSTGKNAESTGQRILYVAVS